MLDPRSKEGGKWAAAAGGMDIRPGKLGAPSVPPAVLLRGTYVHSQEGGCVSAMWDLLCVWILGFGWGRVWGPAGQPVGVIPGGNDWHVGLNCS